MFRKHGWFICLMGLVLLLAALDGFGATPRGTKTRGIYIAEDLGAATSWDDVVWIKRDSSGSLIWADATHTTSTFSASSVWQRIQPWVFLIDISDRLGLGLTSATVRLDMKSLGSTTTTLRIEESGSTQTVATLGSYLDAGLLRLFDGSGSTSISLSAYPTSHTYFNTGGNFGVGTNAPSEFFEVYRSADGAVVVKAFNPNGGSAASMRYRAEAETSLVDLAAWSDSVASPFGGNSGVVGSGGHFLIVNSKNDADLKFYTRTGSTYYLRATIGGTTGTLTLADDLLVNGGDVGVTGDPDILGVANGLITVRGNLNVTGELKGSRQCVVFSRDATTGAMGEGTTASLKLGEVDSWGKGFCTIRAGSIVGMSIVYDVTAVNNVTDTLDDLELKVLKNDVEIWAESLSDFDSVGDANAENFTQVRGTDTFTGGQRISVVLVGSEADSDSSTLDDIVVVLEFVYDT